MKNLRIRRGFKKYFRGLRREKWGKNILRKSKKVKKVKKDNEFNF